MGRDLLYKPPTPTLPSEGEEEAPKKRAERPATPGRGRDLGVSSPPRAAPAPAGTAPPAAPPRPRAGPPAAAPAAAAAPRPAHEAAYFNRDVVATALPNPRARPQRALRGADEVTDLRKVVLPAAAVQTPVPEVLLAAGERMGIGLAERPGLAALMARLGQDAEGAHPSAEALLARMAQLEAMTEARILALARVAALPAERRARAPSAEHALRVQGGGVEAAGDLVADGEMLAERIAEGGRGMHRRVARALGTRAES